MGALGLSALRFLIQLSQVPQAPKLLLSLASGAQRPRHPVPWLSRDPSSLQQPVLGNPPLLSSTRIACFLGFLIIDSSQALLGLSRFLSAAVSFNAASPLFQ